MSTRHTDQQSDCAHTDAHTHGGGVSGGCAAGRDPNAPAWGAVLGAPWWGALLRASAWLRGPCELCRAGGDRYGEAASASEGKLRRACRTEAVDMSLSYRASAPSRVRASVPELLRGAGDTGGKADNARETASARSVRLVSSARRAAAAAWALGARRRRSGARPHAASAAAHGRTQRAGRVQGKGPSLKPSRGRQNCTGAQKRTRS